MSGEVFIDWVTLTQHYPSGGLPILVRGVTTWNDAEGVCRFERASATRVGGSFETAVQVGCTGTRVFLSGNVGRFSRPDNLFNLDWNGTLQAANRILLGLGLPPFTPADGVPGVGGDTGETWGARLLRVDLTANYRAGSEAQARAVIRWLGSQAVQRVKRGQSGDESVWWGNTRHFFKGYLKHAEMLAHGAAKDSDAVVWARDSGIVRVEVEVKRRTLQELELADIGNVSQEKLEQLFREQTGMLRRVDRSDEPDILAAIPARSRAYAAAWIKGADMKQICSRATLYRHAKVIREVAGFDISAPRNVADFLIRVRVVELEAAEAPPWHWTHKAA